MASTRTARVGAVAAAGWLVTGGVGCAWRASSAPLGSVDNPVRSDGRSGEIVYLGSLRCPSGGPPHFHFTHAGPYTRDGHRVDHFDQRCVYDNRSSVVYVDPFHPGFVEERPIEGFEMVPRPAERGAGRVP